MAIPGFAAARAAVVVFALLAAVSTLSGCWDRERSVRYRVTYTFDTPLGERSGSHVLESYYGPCGGAAMGPGCRIGVRGEAAVIDLGDDKFVFAILATGRTGDNVDGPVWLPNLVWAKEIGTLCKAQNIGGSCQIFDVRTDSLPKRELNPLQVLTLVTFEDLNVPSSIKLVDPAKLVEKFGSGFAIQSTTIEITDEKISDGKVAQVLRWVCDYKARGARLNGSTSIGISDNELPNRLGTSSFKRGECK